MASEDVLELTDSSFEAEILNSEIPALVDFWAGWCVPCKQIAPSVDALATEYKGKVKVGKLNIDDNIGVPQKYGVRSIPTLLIFKGGQVVGQIVGVAPQSKIDAELKKHL
ncbi:MAG: thioredoxin [Myxococcales bacterium]|nr:thioredoxin [Myxococcales bacterium]